MMLSLEEIAALTGGLLHGDDAPISAVSTDTRSMTAGSLFVALRGPSFDGHEFLRRAASLGAAGALVARSQPLALPQVEVDDPLAALQTLAAAWRLRNPMPVVAVTGSNGKTTVRQMLAGILAVDGPVLATRGNRNNHIGVPLTLLEMGAEHEAAIIEMGASGPREIALLARLARPDVAVVTNAADAHLAGFGNREGVARAKGELFADLAADGTAIINADDDFAPLWGELAGDRRRLYFGLGEKAEVTARALEQQAGRTRFTLVAPPGEVAVELALPGRHNVANALAAAAAAVALDVPLAAIAAALAAVSPVAGRLQARPAAGGATLLDDSYNANPASLAAGIAVLCDQPGRHWLVLGDMAELGADAVARHAAVGEAAREAGVERLFACGDLAAAAAGSFGPGGEAYLELDSLIGDLRAQLQAGVTVLVKGSRTAGMERVVTAIEDRGEAIGPC
ncbi:MAG: UDP-N-acetylmuramoyl-tripeptide--D-alanyl-D-alanine ligase [Salinisphaera sp.]|nr:UDP-N-acetylmuramoyl-tripeptide--D-alanyl-D-alanine ligase [Salinisphaera sp.]